MNNRIKRFFSDGIFKAHGVRLTCPLLKSDYLTRTHCPYAVKIGDELYVSTSIYTLITESESRQDLELVLDNIRTLTVTGERSILRNVLLLERIAAIKKD